MNYDERMLRISSVIRKCIETGKMKFAIYPYGINGLMTENILNQQFGIRDILILDNNISLINERVYSLSALTAMDTSSYTFLITSTNLNSYDSVREQIEHYVPKKRIVDIFPDIHIEQMKQNDVPKTKVGKYSYGPLCDCFLVEKVGAFCSFAAGTDVTENHALHYISTHPFLYLGNDDINYPYRTYDDYAGNPFYFPRVFPKGKATNKRRITIGNDVWLGRNVLVTNGADIGDGVIAAAGAVITKTVPDYAIVAGIPARVIRYRYRPEQIKKLKQIAWWDWPDDKIRKYYDDFYLEGEAFIEKHYMTSI